MSIPLEIVCWKWKPDRPYRSQFDSKAVNILRNMVARNYSKPHRITCITDDPIGIDSDIRVLPLWDDFKRVPNPSNPKNPSCYRRLRAFSKEAAEIIGPKFCSMDLDIVITDRLEPILDRTEDFVIWGGQALGAGKLGSYNWYNGSLWMLRAGTRTKVWEDFNPMSSPLKAHRAGCRGSDQGWIAYSLGSKEATFGQKDGVHSFRNHVLPNNGKLLKDTRFVAFHGKHDPWHADIQAAYPWVREHYR